MAVIIVDTSAIYALLDRSDANHGKAVAILGRLRDDGDTVLITNLVFAETHALLLSKLGYAVAWAWLRGQVWPVERVLPEDEDGQWISSAPMRTRPSPLRMLRRLRSQSAWE